MKKHLIFISILTVVSLFIGQGFLKPGLPPTDDGLSMVIRASGFHQSIKDGHFPVRWIQKLNENYGYPVMNFLYPLPFYLAEVFNLTFADTLTSIKLIFVLSVVVAGWGVYWLANLWLSPNKAIWPALLYIASPYLLLDLYKRGSLGEMVALAIVPFVFVFILRFVKTKRYLDLVTIGLLWGILITAHNSLGLLFSVLIAVFFVLSINKAGLTKLLNLVLVTAIATGFSCFFWLPALTELSFTRAPNIQISEVSNHFLDITTILMLVGIPSLAIILLSFQVLKNKQVILLLLFVIIALTLQLPVTYPIWLTLDLDRLIQFPVRLLSFIPITTVILLMLLWKKTQVKKLMVVRAIAVLPPLLILVTLVWQMLMVMKIKNELVTNDYLETNFDSSTNQKEFSPISVKHDPTTYAAQPFFIIGRVGGYQINETEIKTQSKFIQLTLDAPIEIVFNTHYFPGWTLLIDGEVVQPSEVDGSGLLHYKLEAPQRRDKKRDIELVWQETPLRQTANTITFVTATLILIFYIFNVTKNIKSTIIGLAIIALSSNLILGLWNVRVQFSEVFNSEHMQKRYLESQWVNADSDYPLGDEGLYAWAGWAYVHGENPILINSEMPPLGKYLIGLGLITIKRPAIVGLVFSVGLLISLYWLSREVLQDTSLALVPVALLSLERIFTSSLVSTMLDPIQITFACLAFLGLLKARKSNRWLVFACVMMGGVLSTKFYAGGLLFISSVVSFYAITGQWAYLKRLLLFLPLAVVVHIISYWKYFLLGNSIREYLGVQKYIYTFYKQGSPDVPFGSYWNLVLLNRWRVWWGPSFGEYYTLTTKEWQITWPITIVASFVGMLKFVNQVRIKWVNRVNVQIYDHHLLTTWLIFYSMFLTTIGGWPHYMKLFLPFAYVLLVKLFSDNTTRLVKIRQKIKYSDISNNLKF